MVDVSTAIPPPSGVEPLTPAEWDKVEESLGALPTDFRHLANTYGGGAFFDELWLPLVRPDSDGTSAFLEFVHSTLDGLSDSADAVLSRTDGTIEPLWPSIGGLIPWASIYSGGYVCWKTTDDHPDHWSCAIVRFDGEPPAIIDCGATDFLLRWRAEDLPVEILDRVVRVDPAQRSRFLPDHHG